MNYQSEKSLNKNKSLSIAIAVGVITALIFSLTIIISYQYYQKQKVGQLQSELNLVTENIRRILSNSNLAAFSVGLTINTDQDTVTNFDYVAEEIMSRHPYLYGVQVLQKGEIKYVFPYDVHHTVLGYDILKDSTTRIEAVKAINSKEIFYAGPLDFVQEGKGIIGRLPVFHEGEFWGFSAVLIKMEDFLKAAGINKTKVDGINILLSKKNPNTGQEDFFTTNRVETKIHLDYTFEESGWKVIAFYKQDSSVYLLLAVIVLLAISSSVGAGLYTYQLLKEPEKLKSLLSEKTKEIEENNEYLTSMVEAIPDLIFVYDKESRYLDFQAYQRKLLFFKPKDFIGKTTFELFEHDFANEIYKAIQKALSSQRVVENSYFLDFKVGRKHFEARYRAINSEKVLAVVRENTESKLAAENLEKSEQKYRNLVSQASDIIFLSDEKGRLLELNKRGIELTGISPKDIPHSMLTEIIEFKSGKGESLLEIILQDGTAFEEANLVSLSSKSIPIEINCKLNSQNQIQGIIRDITARNNFIQSIQKQNERLKEIAWIQSHEVRAPVARLLGLLQYLETYDNASELDKTRIINSIRESALELDLIIREVVKRTELTENTTS